MAPTLRIEYIPVLTITRTNELITVSWPGPADGWLLERTNVLSSASAPWPVVPPPYETNGGTISVTFTNTPAVGNQFFRAAQAVKRSREAEAASRLRPGLTRDWQGTCASGFCPGCYPPPMPRRNEIRAPGRLPSAGTR